MITPKRRSKPGGKASRKRIGNPDLRRQKYQRLLASGAKTNKGTRTARQIADALFRTIYKEILARRGLPEEIRKKVAVRKELMATRRHIGLPAELIPELVDLIILNKIPMENIYAYYRKRKQLAPDTPDIKVWESFLKYSAQRTRLYYNR